MIEIFVTWEGQRRFLFFLYLLSNFCYPNNQLWLRYSKKILKLKKIIQTIAENYKPESIYIFGSYAWGKPTKDSDLDLFIIKETDEWFFKRPTTVRKPLFSDYPMAMDIFVLNNKEIKTSLKRGNIFLNKILSQGKKVYERV